MAIAEDIKASISKSSFIRQMFEKGASLKKKFGDDKVFDFSLGNPNLQPPEIFTQELVKAASVRQSGIHGYMSNVGYQETRDAVAGQVSVEQDVKVAADDIVMSCGAAGGINIAFKTILNPGDEVLVPSPYFVEYGAYASNFNATLKTVETREDFSLDIDAIEGAITEKTKVMLINSPNNPTGQIYSEQNLADLGRVLKEKSEHYGHTIFLVSDEPYRKLVYDGAIVPSIFTCYKESLVITSYSKDISIPGERIGFVAVSPDAEDREDLINGMALANRTLGFVNAPALAQRVVAKIQGMSVDMGEYARKRKLLCEGLNGAGYNVTDPPGTFYLFMKAPIEDDLEFVRILQEELIIAVPGTAFGKSGYIRLAFCVTDETIVNAIPAFKRALACCK
jgi:aspartate aminotransferase